MSADEAAAFFVSGIIALIAWIFWYLGLLRPQPGRRPIGAAFRLLALSPAAAILTLFLLLKAYAANDVRDDAKYLALYTVMGAAWLGLLQKFFQFLGLSARDDVAARSNRSAAFALIGAILGANFAFAGGNFGDGPGWWVVVFSAFLASGALVVAWFTVELATGAAEQITVERSTAAGVRLGGFLLACRPIFGRGVAGDWVSAGDTIADFARWSWPAIVLVLMECITGRLGRPTETTPQPHVLPFGIFPAFMYAAIAIITIKSIGPLP